MFRLNVIDEKFPENSFPEDSENPFELLYNLSQIYGHELVDMAYNDLMKGRTFRYYFNGNHRVVFTLLPVAK